MSRRRQVRRYPILLVASVIIMVCASCVERAHPTDDELAELLDSHKVECDRLVQLVVEDYQVSLESGAIRPDDNTPLTNAGRFIDDDRHAEYTGLVESIALDAGVAVLRSKETIKREKMVVLRVSSIGLPFVGGSEKGLAYSESAPSPLIRQPLDNWGDAAAAYRHLRGNWYVYLWPT